MKVKDLVEKLNALPQELEIYTVLPYDDCQCVPLETIPERTIFVCCASEECETVYVDELDNGEINDVKKFIDLKKYHQNNVANDPNVLVNDPNVLEEFEGVLLNI